MNGGGEEGPPTPNTYDKIPYIASKAHTYGLIAGDVESGSKGADPSRPMTILTVTRNITGPVNNRGVSLSEQADNPARANPGKIAYWKGADKDPKSFRTMAALIANQGQLGLADGSASQSNDSDLENKVNAHHKQLGGTCKGSPSGELDTPNDGDY